MTRDHKVHQDLLDRKDRRVPKVKRIFKNFQKIKFEIIKFITGEAGVQAVARVKHEVICLKCPNFVLNLENGIYGLHFGCRLVRTTSDPPLVVTTFRSPAVTASSWSE